MVTVSNKMKACICSVLFPYKPKFFLASLLEYLSRTQARGK